MAFAHSKSARLLLGDVSFSGFLSSWEHTTERELADATTHTDDGHSFVPGLDNGSLTLGGRVDDSAAAGGQDATLDAALGASAASVITTAPAGFAVGNRVITIDSRESTYSVSAPVAEAVSFEAEWQAEGRVDTGVSLHDLTAETASGNGSSVDGGASTSGGGVAALHVTAASGTSESLTAKVQHSADNTTFVDLVTFTAAGSTAERTAVTGTVNRYVRASWQVSGTTPSFTFAVAFARR